ncbi:hypothetical protein [Crocosphaera chwakensis]|uniref:Uncharacterized protein n=1 Tax=Crocosphaera chwakensis CCY0110 TaxID=391612 RepID=A3IUG5_9CHRO|nr:hypothetical protein [Crocosphaera chwakensis]EAZ89852.1 hypothetical protein CY0110_06189 [Crocosphaera chwakensis CCY0110]
MSKVYGLIIAFSLCIIIYSIYSSDNLALFISLTSFLISGAGFLKQYEFMIILIFLSATIGSFNYEKTVFFWLFFSVLISSAFPIIYKFFNIQSLLNKINLNGQPEDPRTYFWRKYRWKSLVVDSELIFIGIILVFDTIGDEVNFVVDKWSSLESSQDFQSIGNILAIILSLGILQIIWLVIFAMFYFGNAKQAVSELNDGFVELKKAEMDNDSNEIKRLEDQFDNVYERQISFTFLPFVIIFLILLVAQAIISYSP